MRTIEMENLKFTYFTEGADEWIQVEEWFEGKWYNYIMDLDEVLETWGIVF